jgi:hypothetical protein
MKKAEKPAEKGRRRAADGRERQKIAEKEVTTLPEPEK